MGQKDIKIKNENLNISRDKNIQPITRCLPR